MKPTAVLAFFFFLLFAFTTTAEVVVDSNGEPLRNGGKYYLSPPDPIGGRQILAGAIRKGTTEDCSLAVIAALYERGWSTIISSPFRIGFITTEIPLNISFAYLPPNICTKTPEWLVIDSKTSGQAVMVGDAKEFSDPVVKGWFYIKRHDSKYYKLVFSSESDQIGDIGLTNDENGYDRLTVSDESPLVFKFDKAEENSRSGISMVV